MDWSNVRKGRVEPVYDPDRLTEEARQSFANQKKDFGIEVKLGPHGMVASQVPSGIRITVEKASKTDRWLQADRPWEKNISGGNVLYDQGRFRCWYSVTLAQQKQELVFDQDRAVEVSGSATCHAESQDGVRWTRPSVGQYSLNGSKDNNIVTPIWLNPVFRDDHGSPEERYKSFTFAELPTEDVPKGAGAFQKYGLYGVVSPDGYKWTRLPKPLIRYFSDTWSIAAWDGELKKYVGYFRGHVGGRSITRAETEDFRNWPMPQTLLCAGPQEGPSDDYYSNAYTTYPGQSGIRLLFPAIYHQDTDTTDVRMAISSDGRGYNFVSHEPVLGPGAPQEWDHGQVYPQSSLVRLPDGRLALPYCGYSHTHNEGFGTYYKDWPADPGGLAWMTWKDGRLAGVEADEVGDFYCSNTEALKGEAILINARTDPGGKIELELVSKATNAPFSGFSFADCVAFTGDGLWVPLQWKGQADLSALDGQRLQLHFRLTKAKLFGYRIAKVPRSS